MKNVKLNLTNKVKDLNVENESDKKNNGNGKAELTKVQKLEAKISELENNIEEKQREAYEAGLQDGRSEVMEKAEAELNEYAQEFIGSLNNAEEQLQDMLKKAEEPLVDLAINISEQVIRRELNQKNDYENYLKEQLKIIGQKLRNQNNITIRINPGQKETFQNIDLVKYFNTQKEDGIKCIFDKELEPGECIVETENIKIDNTIARQLQNIKKKLMNNE